MWAKVIKSKFGLHLNKWDSGLASRSSYRSTWKFVSSLYEEFSDLVCFKVGNGRRIRFWEDVWWEDEAFSNRFANLYRLSLASNSTIMELIVSHNGSSTQGRDLRFYRNLHDREIENFSNLSVALDQVRLNEASADLRIWKPDRSEGFSCRSAFAALQNAGGTPDFQFFKFIWKPAIPAKIKFFAWSLSLEKINTHDVLQRKRSFHCLSPNWCVMCK